MAKSALARHYLLGLLAFERTLIIVSIDAVIDTIKIEIKNNTP